MNEKEILRKIKIEEENLGWRKIEKEKKRERESRGKSS